MKKAALWVIVISVSFAFLLPLAISKWEKLTATEPGAENISGTPPANPANPTIGEIIDEVSDRGNKWLKEKLGHIPTSEKMKTLGSLQALRCNVPRDGNWSDYIDLHGYEFDFPNFTEGMELMFLEPNGSESQYKIKDLELQKLAGDGTWAQVERGPMTFGTPLAFKVRKGSSSVSQIILQRTYRGNEVEITLPSTNP